MDGANGWNLFRRIIFPLLAPVTVIVVVISVIDSLRAFDLVYVMTRGGPANASQVLANFMYIESFNNYQMGYGASIAVILFLISLAFIITYLVRMLRGGGRTMTAAAGSRQVAIDQETRRVAGQNRLARILMYVGLIIFTLIWIAPVYSTLITSVRTLDDIRINGFWSIPSEITLENFSNAWTQGRVNRYAANSFIITLPALAGMLFLSSLSAYALARFQFRGNRLIYFTFVGGMLLPFQVLMLPVFRLDQRHRAIRYLLGHHSVPHCLPVGILHVCAAQLYARGAERNIWRRRGSTAATNSASTGRSCCH